MFSDNPAPGIQDLHINEKLWEHTLTLEKDPVACDDNMIFTSKPDDQTFVTPYSTDNVSARQ